MNPIEIGMISDHIARSSTGDAGYGKPKPRPKPKPKWGLYAALLGAAIIMILVFVLGFATFMRVTN